MNHYMDEDGNYLGGFDTPPSGALLVKSLPGNALQKWNGEKWYDPKTYREAAAELNTEYQADIDALQRAYGVAGMAGGSTQASKQAAITAQFAARKAKYLADNNALRAQYGA